MCPSLLNDAPLSEYILYRAGIMPSVISFTAVTACIVEARMEVTGAWESNMLIDNGTAHLLEPLKQYTESVQH